MREKYLHQMLPGMSAVEILETMDKDKIVDHIMQLGERAQNIETEMNLAAEVLEGMYGITVADALKEREQPDGEPAA